MSSCRSVARGICKILAASAVEKVHCWICSILILFPILTMRKRRRDNWNTIPGIGYRNLTLSVVVATGETICSPVAGTAGMTIDAMTPWLTEKTAAKEKNSIKVLAGIIMRMNLVNLIMILILGLTIYIVKKLKKILTATMERDRELQMATAPMKWDFAMASSGTNLVCFGN
ncbi:hypothetical protein ES332_D13G119100v1 [Gossypium tomentosum]|uniref:Uncharacterized protein n=1 Tax=Gossypium tomentosum TaxID=34277 RepID=A0A5D2HVW1_GOSTO|nr:hypothetical protein ES332_D13G119100v1 [Gossypium tomentosum]